MASLLLGAPPMASLSFNLSPRLSSSTSQTLGQSLSSSSSSSSSYPSLSLSPLSPPSYPSVYCGRGDKKTAKGKRFNHSFGNARPRNKSKGRGPPRVPVPPAPPKKDKFDDGEVVKIEIDESLMLWVTQLQGPGIGRGLRVTIPIRIAPILPDPKVPVDRLKEIRIQSLGRPRFALLGPHVVGEQRVPLAAALAEVPAHVEGVAVVDDGLPFLEGGERVQALGFHGGYLVDEDEGFFNRPVGGYLGAGAK
ncbi:hypothetical protein RJ639_016930 [Escallonia herrerae]|uniref:Uncharacterized protein n=1 Tax=Escallonia herrerae TaxID=1293975 RepID=A0AA88VB31_9ASTE|nr:hypothetical protein RJ639_016930 [Escallonia herrerae]